MFKGSSFPSSEAVVWCIIRYFGMSLCSVLFLIISISTYLERVDCAMTMLVRASIWTSRLFDKRVILNDFRSWYLGMFMALDIEGCSP